MSNNSTEGFFSIWILDKWESIQIYIFTSECHVICVLFFAISFVLFVVPTHRPNLKIEANNLGEWKAWIVRSVGRSTDLFKGSIYSKMYIGSCFPESHTVALCFQRTFDCVSMNNLSKQLILFSTWRVFLCSVWSLCWVNICVLVRVCVCLR